jgi:hypothetical protein
MSPDDLELLMLLGSSKPEEDAAAVAIADAVYSAAYASVSGDAQAVFGPGGDMGMDLGLGLDLGRSGSGSRPGSGGGKRGE